ncbi:MAG: VOC family protein [Geminicoccaceae bacterium]
MTRPHERSADNGFTLDILINIDVDDLRRAEAFYTRAFGLAVGRRLGPDIVELTGGSSPIYLLVKADGSEAGAAADRRRYRRHWTPVHLDFVVDDLDQALERATQAGARQEGDVGSFDWGRIATLADPFGHGFCLIQFLGRGYDALVDERP